MFKFIINNKNNHCLYIEDYDGYWNKTTYDENNNLISYETSYGFCTKFAYNENGELINYQASHDICYGENKFSLHKHLLKFMKFFCRIFFKPPFLDNEKNIGGNFFYKHFLKFMKIFWQNFFKTLF